MNEHHESACDAVDACVFSGDMLVGPESRDEFREHLARWTRAVDAADATEGPPPGYVRCKQHHGENGPGAVIPTCEGCRLSALSSGVTDVQWLEFCARAATGAVP